MYWCHSCSNNTHSNINCSHCHSQALQQINTITKPQQYTPYEIQQQIQQEQQEQYIQQEQQKEQQEEEQKQQEQFLSFSQLYTNAYRDLLSAARQQQPQTVQTINSHGNTTTQYTFVLNTTIQDQQIRPLTYQQIQSLTTKIIHSQCSICQQTKPQPGYILNCNHQFHYQCLTPWITKTATCPTCRYNLLENTQ